MAIGAQSSGFWAWPMFFPELRKEALTVPIALTLISLGFWPNYVHEHSVFPFIRGLARLAKTLHEKRSKTYALVAPWKCLVYLMTLLVLSTTRISFDELMEPDPFGSKPIFIWAWGKASWSSNQQAFWDPNAPQPSWQRNQWNRASISSFHQLCFYCTENAPPNWPPQPITHPPGHTAATHPPGEGPNPETDFEVEVTTQGNTLNKGSILGANLNV